MAKRNPEREREILARIVDPDCAGSERQTLYTELESYRGQCGAEDAFQEAVKNRDAAIEAAENRRLQAEANERARWSLPRDKTLRGRVDAYKELIRKIQEPLVEAGKPPRHGLKCSIR